MPPEAGKLLGKHILYPEYKHDLQERIEAKKQEMISRFDEGFLLAKNKRPNAKNGKITPIETKLGEDQFIFLHLIVTPDLPLPKRYHVPNALMLLEAPPNHLDQYGFAFDLETLSSINAVYREKDLLPEFIELCQKYFNKELLRCTEADFDNLSKEVQAKLLLEVNEKRASDKPLAQMLKEINYQENRYDEYKPEILVRTKLDLNLTSWFIVGGKYLTKTEFEEWRASQKLNPNF